jgi:hypothetical protein
MLINNLGSLKAELARYMFHQRFAPDYDTAVQNFEALANRRLRVRPMETVTNLTTTNGETEIPPDYLLWRTVLWAGRTPYPELEYVHPAYLRSTWIEMDRGDPKIFTIEGDTFKARPVRDDADAYELHYYRKIPTINGNDNNSNWLLTDHPDLYLEGTLFELFVLGRNGEAAVAHKQMRDEKFGELIQFSALTTGATSSLVRGEGSALGSGGEYF